MVDRVTAVLLRVASELLHVKIEDLDVHGDMYEYGFDPVSLASLLDQLNREYALDEVAQRAGVRPLTPTLLLEHHNGQPPTLSGLAQFLATEYALAFAFPTWRDPRIDEELNALLRHLLHDQLVALGLPLAGERPAHLPAFYDRWFEESRTYLVGLTHEREADDPWAAWERKKVDWLADPNMKAMVVLLETALRALPDILTGKRSATDVLFPDASFALVEDLYQHNPIARYLNEVVADTVVAYMEARQAATPGRILEIGAGTGGTSALVLERLEPYRDALGEYCYTDISRAFLLHAERTYGQRYPYLAYRVFDVTAPPAVQGIEAGGYDIVIAANVLHATKNIRQAIRNAKATLKKGGLLVLNELHGKSLLTHLTFGLLEGWWLYEDEELRIPGTPALAPATWQAVLEEEGFDPVYCPVPEAHDMGLQVVVAQSNGIVRQERAASIDEVGWRASAPAPALANPSLPPTQPPRPRRTQPISASLWREKCTAYVANLIGKTLGIPAHNLDPKTPLEEYGLDSILVVQLTNTFREVMDGITSTLFFEVHTIDALVDRLLDTHKDSLVRLVGLGGEERQVVASASDSLSLRERVRVREATDRHQPTALSQGDRGQEGRLSDHEPATMPTASGNRVIDVAIIGLAGRYPLAADVHEFWDNLKSGRNCIQEVPHDRWDWREFFDADKGKPGKSYSKWGGFLSDIDKFDPLFFHISPPEAEMLDPQERLFLEQAYACIEDAGYTPASLGASTDPAFPSIRKVGVFVGVMNSHYTGRASFYSIANRVSYVFDFHGPSIAVDTACSASLTAIHLALESLYSGTSDCALAGGVNLIIDPDHYVNLAANAMLSASNACKAFGDQADGLVDGEGVGVILLKPLARAIADNDHIYGVIKGSMVNAGGKTSGYTVPNPAAQAHLIAAALKRAGVDARTINYLEAHGTGTVLGDPIEIRGLTLAFEQASSITGRDRQFCSLGSVKSNIGHTESAAGIAGVTKVLLQMQHQQLVPSIHARTLNANIDFAQTPFVVQQTLAPWPQPQIDGRQMPRRAGVSSFGAGGANAHVVIEEYVSERPYAMVQGPYIIILSAKNETRLKERAQRLLGAIRRTGPGALGEHDLADMAYTLQVGREAMDERLALIVNSLEELEQKLDAFVVGGGDGARMDDLLRGQVKHGKNALAAFSVDEELQAAVESWIHKRKYSRLLELWVNGLSIDWRALYLDGELPRRISLPTYPFARESYWRDRARRPAEHQDLGIGSLSLQERDRVRAGGEGVWDGLTYLPTWEEQAPRTSVPHTSSHRTVLLVYPDASATLANTIADFYGQLGTGCTVIQIQLSDRTEQIAPHVWRCDIHDANGIDTCLRAYDRIDGLYFIAAEASDVSLAPDSLRASLQTHEIQLLRLVQCLKQHEMVADHVDCYILTLDNYRLDGSMASAAGGGLTGLTYAIAQADYRFQVRHIDLSRQDLDTAHLRDAIASEPATDRGEVVKLRAGRRYKQVFLKLDWSSPREGTAFREGGVYVIVGGSGTIGTILTRYLIRTYQAKIIWIGRRPETDPTLRENIDACRALGEPPTYIQADVTDARAVEQAHARIKGDYPAVHGAIFAGLVFDAENSVYNTSEQRVS